MELHDITMDDLALYESLLTDPVTMAELGGPLAREPLAEKLRGIVRDVEETRIWYFTIVPDDSDERAGTVCVWSHDGYDEPINEIGWMVLPASRGRGLASGAVRMVLERATAERRWEVIHAFPGGTNGPSNAICRKNGFAMLGERDIVYAGRSLRCNYWRVDPRP